MAAGQLKANDDKRKPEIEYGHSNRKCVYLRERDTYRRNVNGKHVVCE